MSILENYFRTYFASHRVKSPDNDQSLESNSLEDSAAAVSHALKILAKIHSIVDFNEIPTFHNNITHITVSTHLDGMENSRFDLNALLKHATISSQWGLEHLPKSVISFEMCSDDRKKIAFEGCDFSYEFNCNSQGLQCEIEILKQNDHLKEQVDFSFLAQHFPVYPPIICEEVEPKKEWIQLVNQLLIHNPEKPTLLDLENKDIVIRAFQNETSWAVTVGSENGIHLYGDLELCMALPRECAHLSRRYSTNNNWLEIEFIHKKNFINLVKESSSYGISTFTLLTSTDILKRVLIEIKETTSYDPLNQIDISSVTHGTHIVGDNSWSHFSFFSGKETLLTYIEIHNKGRIISEVQYILDGKWDSFTSAIESSSSFFRPVYFDRIEKKDIFSNPLFPRKTLYSLYPNACRKCSFFQFTSDSEWNPDYDSIRTYLKGSDYERSFNDKNLSFKISLHRLNKELIFKEKMKRAAYLFGLIVCVKDEHLVWPKRIPPNEKTLRFYKIALQLPLDLQMVLANRFYRLAQNTISPHSMEFAFRRFFFS